METVFAIGDPEAATDEQLSAISAEKHRQNRRAAQRNRRTNQDTAERHLIRDQNSGARRVARSVLADADRERIRIADTTAHTAARSTGVQASTNRWWDQVSRLNSSQVPKPLGLRWNRVCKHCGIRVCKGHRFTTLDCERRFLNANLGGGRCFARHNSYFFFFTYPFVFGVWLAELQMQNFAFLQIK
jgi:hypothetical protein